MARWFHARAPQPSPAPAAEREQVVRAQRRQLGRAHRSAAADQEVAKVAPVVDHRRFGEPAITTQEPAIALDQLVVGRLVRHDRGEGALLAQHHEQVRQAPADRFFSLGPPGGGNSDTPADDRRGSPRRPPHREPGHFPSLRAGPRRGERRRARSPGTSARHSRARAASGPAEWPLPPAGPPPSARRTARSRMLRALPTSTACVGGEASRRRRNYVKRCRTPDREVTDSATQLHIRPTPHSLTKISLWAIGSTRARGIGCDVGGRPGPAPARISPVARTRCAC